MNEFGENAYVYPRHFVSLGLFLFGSWGTYFVQGAIEET